MAIGTEIALIGAGLGVGALGSLHCVGMCGPFAALAGTSGGARGVLTYSAGRLLTYGTLGALSGVFGAALAGLRVAGIVASVGIIIVVALQIAGVLPEPRFAARWTAPLAGRIRRSGAGRFGLGASTALLPCGLVYAGLGVAMTSASPLIGAAVMVAFGLGTVPLLMAFGVGAGKLAHFGVGARRVVALTVAVAGLWAIVHRTGASVDGSPETGEGIPSCCHGAESP